MSYANPIDTRIVQIVLDDLEDHNNHTLWQLLSAAYGLQTAFPESVLESARSAAFQVLDMYRETNLR